VTKGPVTNWAVTPQDRSRPISAPVGSCLRLTFGATNRSSSAALGRRIEVEPEDDMTAEEFAVRSHR
jgi:hypothetical protein